MVTAKEIIDRLFTDLNVSSEKQESLRTTALRWINEGQEDIAKQTLCLEAQAELRTSDGHKQYPLPGKPPITDCLGIQDVLLDGVELTPTTLSDLAAYYDDWTTQTGTPVYYLPRMSGFQWRLWLIPIPTSNSSVLNIFYYRRPNKIERINQGIVVDTGLLQKYLKAKLLEHLEDPRADNAMAKYEIEREMLVPILRVKQMQKMPVIRRVWP